MSANFSITKDVEQWNCACARDQASHRRGKVMSPTPSRGDIGNQWAFGSSRGAVGLRSQSSSGVPGCLLMALHPHTCWWY